jgi:hypothetical protein
MSIRYFLPFFPLLDSEFVGLCSAVFCLCSLHIYCDSCLTSGERNTPRHQLPLACKYFHSLAFLVIRRIILGVPLCKNLENTSLGILRCKVDVRLLCVIKRHAMKRVDEWRCGTTPS